MTPAESALAAARRLMEAHRVSSRGPWVMVWNVDDGDDNGYVDNIYDAGGNAVIQTDSGVYGPDKEDAAFIVAAHEGVPILVAEVERLRARVAELETALNTDPDCFDHADNVCVDWCGGCQRGVYGRAKRASAMTPGETP